MAITFMVSGKPIQQGSMRAVRGHVFHNKSKELMDWRRKVALEAVAADLKPVGGAVKVTIRFFYERPKTVARVFPTVPPDLDKQIRSILDALTGVAYNDDAQVVSIVASKAYGAPGAEITVETF